jgi:phage gpG-like protein
MPSVISFTIDEDSEQRLKQFLGSLGPRLGAEAHQALKTLLYLGAQTATGKYFAGTGPKGGPTTSLLTSRSGALANSLLASVETGIDPPSPNDSTTQITGDLGSSLPYAAIQEYGGVAGRAGPFKKKDGKRPYLPPRPYLQPTLSDMEDAVPDLFRQAVDQALEQK